MEIWPRLAALRLFAERIVLTNAERDQLLALPGHPQSARAHEDFVRLGEEMTSSCLVAQGIVGRFVQLEDGSRQIVSLHIPGDMADLFSLMLPRAPSQLQALTASTVIRIPHAALRQLAFDHWGLAAAFWRDSVVDGSIVAQWLVNVGRRNARGRLAHLFCEMAVRYRQIAMGGNGYYELPVGQEQLADALGLTPVHVNRSLKGLREEGLVHFLRGRVDILDWSGLANAAEFDPAYLHLPPSVAGLDYAAAS